MKRANTIRLIFAVVLLLGIAIAALLLIRPITLLLQRQGGKNIDREFLVEDIRQLASILEESHPDPYTRFGGKIEFHRAMQLLITGVPEDGLSLSEFYWHLTPFVARLRDSHTSIWNPAGGMKMDGGALPLTFEAIEQGLYIAAVTDSAYASLLGFRLLSVETIPLSELVRRQESLRGSDNYFHTLRMLGYDGALWNLQDFAHLIPEWIRRDSISLILEDHQGQSRGITIARNISNKKASIRPQTTIPLPSTDQSDYVFDHVPENSGTMILLLENMYSYRESFEMERSIRGDIRRGLARQLYSRYNNSPPPSGIDELIAGIPSATEIARDLVTIMKKNRTRTLIVDLRRNQGGNAFISTIFYYFFYGKEAMVDFGESRSILIKKYSDLFWKQYPNRDLQDINIHQPLELIETDYDFSGYPDKDTSLSREDVVRLIEEEAILSSTFWTEYQDGTYSGFYAPEQIYLLCSPVTTSSGYAFMYDHWRGGAKVVGTPSSQAGNNSGAWVGFELDNSGLRGGVSHLYITHFRDDPEMGQIFRPDYRMTFEKLRSHRFDPNSALLYALEISGASTQ